MTIVSKTKNRERTYAPSTLETRDGRIRQEREDNTWAPSHDRTRFAGDMTQFPGGGAPALEGAAPALADDAPVFRNGIPDVEQSWPDLFSHLSPHDRARIRNMLIGGWSEGWVPNRADTAAIVDHLVCTPPRNG